MKNYAGRIAVNAVIILSALVLKFLLEMPYLSDEMRIDAGRKAVFSSKAEVIYEGEKINQLYDGEKYYILKYMDDYAVFSPDTPQEQVYTMPYPDRYSTSLHFQQDLTMVVLGQDAKIDAEGNYHIESINGDYVFNAVVISKNEEVAHIELDRYKNRECIDTFEFTKSETAGIFEGKIKSGGSAALMKQYQMAYTESFTIKGYNADGVLIAENKCRGQRINEGLEQDMSEIKTALYFDAFDEAAEEMTKGADEND